PAPLLEVVVAGRLLARLGATAADALSAVLDGQKMITLGLHPLGRNGRATMVPAGAIADQAIVRRNDALLLVDAAVGRCPVTNLGAMPVADLDIGGDATVLVEGPAAVTAFEAAIDDWLVLTAAALVGIAARSVEIGVAYAAERRAWGRPIGSYQAVAHP